MKTRNNRVAFLSRARAALAAFAAAATFAAFADSVTTNDVMAVVRGWQNAGEALGERLTAEPESVKEYSGLGGTGTYYVVSFAGGGYVVTSGDTAFEPVLAYSRNGSWVEDEAQNPLKAMVEIDIAAATTAERGSAGSSASGSTGKSSGQRLAVAATSASASGGKAAKWEKFKAAVGTKKSGLRLTASAPSSDLRVAPLVTTAWNQSTAPNGRTCWNKYTPGNYVCGCVATMAAQLMRYWAWPDAAHKLPAQSGYSGGVGSSGGWNLTQGYRLSSDEEWQPWAVTPFDTSVSYDWANMPDTPTTDAHCAAMGRFLLDVGLSVYMNYTSGGSGTQLSFVGKRLLDQYAYRNAVVRQSGLTASERDNAILASLDAKLPCCVAVSKTGGAHAIVADGYGYDGEKTLYLHFNMGWGYVGTDTWYTPPNVGSYTSLYSVIYNIYPPTDKDGIAREAGLSIVSGTLLDNAGSPLGGATVTAYNRTTDETVTATTAASTGRFVLWLPAGSYSISAASGGYTALYTKRIETIGDPLDDAGWVKDAGIVGNIHGLELKLETPAATPTASAGDIAEFHYPNTLAVTLSAASGATIHYTLDGSEPTDESPIYDGPIVLSETTTVRARAYADGMSPSAVMTQTFTRNEYLYKDVPDVYFDYAESSGTQWIDTGINARSGTKVEIESAVEFNPYSTVYGTFGGLGHTMLDMPDQRYPNRMRAFNKNNDGYWLEVTTDINHFDNIVHEIDTSGKGYITAISGLTWPKGTCTLTGANDGEVGAYDIGCSMYIFAAHNANNGGVYNPATLKLRRFRIWQTAAYDSGSDYALVRDFRPCGKLQEDGTYKVGLYDAVSGIIFYPQGGSLAYGKILSYVEEPQELLQHAQSNCDLYLDTGVTGRSGTKMEIGFTGWQDNWTVLGGSLGNGGFHLLAMNGNGLSLYYNNSGQKPAGYSADGAFHDMLTEWNIDGTGKFALDGGEKKTLAENIAPGTTAIPMYLFAGNNNGAPGWNARACIRSARIWQMGSTHDDYTLARDFHPCKGARGVGFYDAVTKSIFYPEGGTLTAGTVIARRAEPKQLYQRYNANAAASFDLGLKMRSGTKMEMRGFGVWANVGLMAVKDGTGAEYGLIKDANNMIAITAGSVTNSTTKGGNGGHQVVKAEFALDGTLSVIANGDSLVTSAGVPFDTGLNFYLFGKNNNGSNATLTFTEFWGARIWQTDENGVYRLVRDLWPCADESGVSGLYDRVSGMIFYSFTGTDGGLIDLLAVREEPSAYLQSVSSGSGQYIDTAVEAKSGTKTEVSISKCTTTGHYAVLGAIGDPRSYHMLLVANGTAFRTFYPSATSDQSTGDVSAGDLTGTTVRNIVSEWGADGNVRVTLNGTEKSLSTSGADFDTGITLYLFDGNRYRRSTGITIHGARLWQVDEDGEYTLMRDYRPCLGNGPGGATPGTPGLYDSVSGMIFYSPSGTPLTAGPVISKKAEPAEFIQYVGSTNYVDGVMQHAYVDTGVVGRSGTKAEVAFTGWTDYNTAIFGCRQGGNHFLWFKNGYSSLRFIYKGTSQYETLPCGDNTYNVLAVGVGEDGSATVSINGTEYAGDIVSQGAYSSGLNAYLLAGNAEGGATWNVNARIYSAKIWQTDESGDYALVRDYRPCKDSDGVAGLYDAVSGHIFYSASGTPLAAGPSLMKAEEPTKLYSYVESSGTQYIDTGVVGRQHTTVEVRFTGWTGNFTALYGAIGSSGVHYLGFHNWGYYRFIYGPSGDGGDYMKSIAFGDDTLNTVRSDVTADGAITLTVNGSATAVPLTMGAQTTLLNMYLFAGNSRGSVYQPATAKVYSCRIWQDGELVRDFYPCEGSEGVGLYDAVNGNIYYPLGGMLEHGADLAGATARWIGETPSSAADFENPNNWRILAADGVTKIDGVVPNKGMDVIVDGDVGYSFTSAVPWPVSSWKSLKFGPGAITLTSDCDWSGVGTVTLEAGTTIDLSGHILTVGGFASSSAETVSILNSGDMATVSFAVADGGTSAVNGFTFAGDILFAKTGNGSVSLRPSKFVLAADAEFQFSGVSLDLSGTTLELADPDGLAGNFVFATSDAAIAGNPTASNLPKGWKVKKSADGKTLTIKRSAGVKILVF